VAYPVLRLYDPSAETELHTDACAVGLGAILLQKQADKSWASVAYFSHPNSETEKNYHSFELEMLAVVRTIERFHIYLYGKHFRCDGLQRPSLRYQESLFKSAYFSVGFSLTKL